MAWRKIASLLVLILTATGAPAFACSVDGDYVRPSNFELVQIADAIVVATAEAQSGDVPDPSVTFRVESAVKGAPPRHVSLGWAALGRTTPSDLADLSTPHPEAYAGPCNRTTFAQGSRYLLFLRRGQDGSWGRLGYPFSRINEDYAGEDNDWMRSVRRYAHLQSTLAPMEQISALRRMAETGRDPEGRTLSSAERSDIVDHLGSISQWKPTPFLLDLYGRLERGEPLPYAPRPDSANAEGGDADRIAALVFGPRAPTGARAADRERLMVLRALAEGDHPDALPLFDRLESASDTGAGVRGLVLRYLARNGHYPRAYRWIESRLMAELPRLAAGEAMGLIRDVALVQRGEPFEEGRERWRSDPHAAATWPELALALYWYQVRAFGEGHTLGFGDAVRTIEVADYRSRPEVTLARAGDYDESVRSWAIAELARPPRPQGGETDAAEAEDPASLPLRVLVSAWTEDNDPVLTRAFCQGGERRRLVLLALGQWGSTLYESLLAGMAATPGLSEEERSWLVRAAIEMTARRIADSNDSFFGADEEDWGLLTRLIRGRPIGVPALSCSAPGARPS